MLFAEGQPVSEWRDTLALWADVLGVAGFVISVFGVIVGLWVKREVKRARAEANERIGLFLRQQTHRDIGYARQFLLLALEACRGKQWIRAHGHFDLAIDVVTRLLSVHDFDEESLRKIREIHDDLLILSKAVFKRKSESHLADDRLHLLDYVIGIISEIETARFHTLREEIK